MNPLPRIASVIALGMTTLISSAYAGVITDLHNTGAAAIGSADPNYQLITSPRSLPAISIPTHGAWVASGPNAKWIGVQTDTRGPGGSYVYRTQFTIPSHADLTTVVLQADWASDNVTTDILVNGGPTGINNPGTEFRALAPFTIAGHGSLTHGTNTLDFVMSNGGFGPTGLLVTNLRGTFVPEPGTACAALMAICSATAVGMRKRLG